MAEAENAESKALHVKRTSGSFQKMHVVQHNQSPIRGRRWQRKEAERAGRLVAVHTVASTRVINLVS